MKTLRDAAVLLVLLTLLVSVRITPLEEPEAMLPEARAAAGPAAEAAAGNDRESCPQRVIEVDEARQSEDPPASEDDRAVDPAC